MRETALPEGFTAAFALSSLGEARCEAISDAFNPACARLEGFCPPTLFESRTSLPTAILGGYSLREPEKAAAANARQRRAVFQWPRTLTI